MTEHVSPLEYQIRCTLLSNVDWKEPDHGALKAARIIAALIVEREAEAYHQGVGVGDGARRMCLVCGKTVPAGFIKPGDELPECIGAEGMAACTFDTTPQEAWQYWSTEWHKLHASLSAPSLAVPVVEAIEAAVKHAGEAMRAQAAKECDGYFPSDFTPQNTARAIKARILAIKVEAS